MRKYLLLIVVVFMLSGCTVNYDLEINSDLTVEESIVVLNHASYFEVVGSVKDVYKNTVDLGMHNTNYITYDYISNSANDLYGVSINKTYSSLDDFKENASSLKELYDDIEITQNGTIVIINSIGEFNIERISINTEDEIRIPENCYFSIKLPFVVTYNNADKVDSLNNIYYWYIDEATTNEKAIKLSFDTSKTTVLNKVSNLNYTFILIVVIILIVAFSYNKVKTKNKKNNEI